MEKPQIPEELKKKFEELKLKLEKFKKAVLVENKEIIGITLLPPRKEAGEVEKPSPNKINVLVLVDDSNIELKKKFEFRENIVKKVEKIAEELDKNLNVETMLIVELREELYDAKYEILQDIALSAIIYDPKEMLAALKLCEIHKNIVLKKFEKYIVSYVAAGSLFRGDKIARDIDVYIIVDDTDVKRMSRFELKDKLRSIIITQGYQARDLTGIQKEFHIQTYILTDFWESVKDAHPVIFTFLRDGIPLYDRGIFMPWKLLLEMGRIRPSPEAIDMQMDIGEKLLERVKNKMLGVVAEDLYYSILNPAQACLMLYGINPPTPKETISLMREIFVKKERILEERYVKILEKLYSKYKDIEHGKIKDISGKETDALSKECQLFLMRIKKLFKQIEKRKGGEDISEIYDSCVAVTKEVLESLDIKIKGRVETCFKRELIDKHKVPAKLNKILRNVEKSVKEYKAKKLTKEEAENVKRDARTFLRTMMELLQRKKAYELERAKVRFKYGDKIGEVILLEKDAFIIDDIEAKEKKINKAVIVEGHLKNFKKITLNEMEKILEKTKLPEKILFKEEILNDLKKRYNKKISLVF